MAEEFLWHKVTTKIVYIQLNVHTKYVHVIHCRHILKYVDHDRSVRELYERYSIYKQTYLSGSFIEKHAISTELF